MGRNSARTAWFLSLVSVVVAAPKVMAQETDAHKAAEKQPGFGLGMFKKFPGGKKEDLPKVELSSAPFDHAKLASCGQVLVGTEAQPNGHRWVKGAVHIKASPAKVWETVHEERRTDPDLDYSKVLEEGSNHILLEQKFNLIPVIGTSVCVMKNTEVPHQRIDYSLVKSDRFKAMEGRWVLTPSADGGTVLELASYIDMGLPVPRNIIEGVTAKKIERRLTNVRKMAEGTTTKVPSVAEGIKHPGETHHTGATAEHHDAAQHHTVAEGAHKLN